jgi:hypothetical protein
MLTGLCIQKYLQTLRTELRAVGGVSLRLKFYGGRYFLTVSFIGSISDYVAPLKAKYAVLSYQLPSASHTEDAYVV